MEALSNQLLIEAYSEAKKLNLDPKFIELLKIELNKRQINTKELAHISNS